MEKNDILKYSQQIISYTSDTDYNVASGFFVCYCGYRYFITANHAITYDEIGESKPIEKTYFILHIHGSGLTTKVINLNNWQTIDLFKVTQTDGIFPAIEFDEIEDVAFCSIYPESLKNKITELPFRLEEAQLNSCQKKQIYSIPLTNDIVSPNTEDNYYLAGKILKESNSYIRKYVEYFYENIKYIGMEGKFYVFQMPTNISIENMKGLSGSPVFDSNKNCIGMAIRYREYNNTIVVLPIGEIVYYLKNDCMPDIEEESLNN